MNWVQPIKDFETVQEIKDYLRKKNTRDFLLFFIGISTGLRISDILELKVKHFKTKKLVIREKKTKKIREIDLSPELLREIRKFTKNKHDNEFLFQSRQKSRLKRITRQRAYGILRDVAEEFHLEHIGTHTLRKTYGYHFYMQFKNIAVLQKAFNHSDPSVTAEYICITDDEVNEHQKKFRI